MQIHGIKLTLRNFWIPLFLFTILASLIYFFGSNYIAFKISEPLISYYRYFTENFMNIFIFSVIYVILLMILPVFFIIRRMLSKEPRKVFCIELPILFVIFALYNNLGLINKLILGEITAEILIYRFFSIGFILIWISLLTISMYFYYKKFVKQKHL